jgi:hypothetical protein
MLPRFYKTKHGAYVKLISANEQEVFIQPENDFQPARYTSGVDSDKMEREAINNNTYQRSTANEFENKRAAYLLCKNFKAVA